MVRKTYDNLILSLAAGDPSAGEWIRKAAIAVVASRGDVGLEKAARLSRTASRRRQGLRDAYLRQAALIVGGGRPAGPKEMHAVLRRFESGLWRDWRSRWAAPDYASELEVALFNALKAGAIPTTPQGLGRALSEN